LLAARIGPRGRVVGLEVDRVHVAIALELVAEQGLTNVEAIQADARQARCRPPRSMLPTPGRCWSTSPIPERYRPRLGWSDRAAGSPAWSRTWPSACITQPTRPGDRLHEIFIAAFQADGVDPFIGRRLPELFREAGLSDIGVRAHAELYPTGQTRRTIRLDLVRSMRPKIIPLGIAREQELDDLDRAAREHLDDPHTLVLPHLSFLAWGRKPTT
jgi:hypothetical protein